MRELAGLGVLDLAELLQAREVTSTEVVTACLQSIEHHDEAIGAWARTYAEWATEQAEASDRRLSQGAVRSLGPAPPLCGVPVGLKDVIAVAGKPLTLGCELFAGAAASTDAAAWAKLRAEGMVLIGHTRTQELALGNAPQTVRNPWDLTRSPGGSSNGSAAAVAAGMVPVALGTDVGGSLRRPASACGLTTIMATAGAVHTDGVFTFDAAADHVGPLARSAADCAALLDAIATVMPPLEELYRPSAERPDIPGGLRLGLVEIDGDEAPEAPVAAWFERCAREMGSLGAELVEVAAPREPVLDRRPRQEQVDFFRVHHPSRRAFSPPVRERGEEFLRLSAGDGVRSDRANRDAIRAWRMEWEELFAKRKLDALLLPAQTRETPLLPPAGEGGDVDRFGGQRLRTVWNEVGLPVVCVPAGPLREGGPPLGMQLVGPPNSEKDLLRIAIGYQAVTPYHRRRARLGIDFDSA